MATGKMIYKVRTEAKLSQEDFAELFGVSRQAVQKWECGASKPELEKLVKIAKHFDISLDTLVLGSDSRLTDELQNNKEIKPKYNSLSESELYFCNLMTEYEQSIEEGLDLEIYHDVFASVARLPKSEFKKKMGDALFDVVINAPQKEGYPFEEPSDPEGIKRLRKAHDYAAKTVSREELERKIHGAWMGRICGCLLGKSVEGMRTNELVPFLKETGNYPMHRYILHSDLTDEIIAKYKFRLAHRCYADVVDGMPVDDDTNYVILSQMIVEKYGRDFTSHNVAKTWLETQPKDAYWTAERVAFRNFINGYEPPESAVYKNPYREWIGAQIRGDYFGYINPGNPEAAADMAFRDASISHVKNGIYGEMFAAAMLACAAETDDIEDVIRGGLAQIPATSRLYEAIDRVIRWDHEGVAETECFNRIHEEYNEYTTHGWCHTISNAMIVAAALLYGKGDYGRSICMAVETGFDTDCNGATVGSVLGMIHGIDSLDDYWTSPIRDTLHTSIFGVDTVKISERVKKTMTHII